MKTQIIGLIVLSLSISIAAFTSNLFISKKEKDLAKLYAECKKDLSGDRLAEAKHAYLNTRTALTTRYLAAIGIILIAIDYFI